MEKRKYTRIQALSGMAQGVDLWRAQIVLNLKKKNPALNLHAILPCEGQESKWPAPAQALYRSILEQADEAAYMNREYSAIVCWSATDTW